MPQSFGNLLSAASALAIVLGLVLLAARGVRAAGFGKGAIRNGPNRRLTLLDTLVLDRARRLTVVRCDGRDLLLVTGGAADLVVGWLPPPQPRMQPSSSLGDRT